MDDDEITYLADGREVPTRCIKALEDFETVWPGATFRGARAAVVWRVLEAYKKEA